MSELEFIYLVAFNNLLASLSVIYENFTPEQIGCMASRL